LSPPLTGAVIAGHEQFGAVTARVFSQLFSFTTLRVMFVADGTPVIDHESPLMFVTVPDVLVTVPELTPTTSEYVNRSGAHAGAVVMNIVGKGFTKFCITDEVAVHPLAFVTITSTPCPLINVLVVYVADVPFCTPVPPTLKL
jgi:hypothetical protein